MASYLMQRLIQMVFTAVIVSIISFAVIELPPGDYLDNLRAELEMEQLSGEQIEGRLRLAKQRYALGQPIYVRYFRWFGGIMQGDLGYSMAYNRRVSDLVGSRILLSVILSASTLVFTLVVGVSIGVFSALRQYSVWDHILTFIGFIGLAIPNFLLALLIMFIVVTVFGGRAQIGLFSPQFIVAPWSLAKFWDLMTHIWLPVVIIGTSGTAGMIRVVRARMLDTLWEPYMQTARMKGIKERRAVFRHALKVAINPVISSLGLAMPTIISGEIITSIVLQLPTIGPLLYNSLLMQDMYLAATILFFLAIALVVGNLLADLGLAWLDPRIRYD